MTDRHRTMDPRLDDDDPEVPEPAGPEPREPSDNQTLSSPVNELENRLFGQRKVLVFGAITDKVARDVTGRLLALAGASDKPIDLFVNSPGGHVESGDTIHDMVRFVDAVAPVRVVGTGWVASAGALIFLAGVKERRLCLPNTRFLPPWCMGRPVGRVRAGWLGGEPSTTADARHAVQEQCRPPASHSQAATPGHQLGRIRRGPARPRQLDGLVHAGGGRGLEG
jgi:Clp protease